MYVCCMCELLIRSMRSRGRLALPCSALLCCVLCFYVCFQMKERNSLAERQASNSRQPAREGRKEGQAGRASGGESDGRTDRRTDGSGHGQLCNPPLLPLLSGHGPPGPVSACPRPPPSSTLRSISHLDGCMDGWRGGWMAV